MAVSERNTKKEILEYVEKLEQKLKEERIKKETTVDRIAKEHKQECIKKADNLIEKNILNDSIVEEYNALKETKENLKQEIKDLYGIETNLETLEALIITQNELSAKHYNEHKEKVECLHKEYENIKNNLEEQKKKLELEIANMEINAKKEHEDLLAKLQLTRKRNEEEYNYNLKRQRQKENDAWEDEKEKRLAELFKRENEVLEKEERFKEELSNVYKLKETIDNLTKQLDEKYKEGLDKGKADAGKKYGIEKAALEKEYEANLRIKDAELSMTKDRLNETLSKLTFAEEKLEAAYNKINETAKTVAMNSATKIIESKDNK